MAAPKQRSDTIANCFSICVLEEKCFFFAQWCLLRAYFHITDKVGSAYRHTETKDTHLSDTKSYILKKKKYIKAKQ